MKFFTNLLKAFCFILLPLIFSCNDGSGPFPGSPSTEFFTLRISDSTHTDVLLTDADVRKKKLTSFVLTPNYTNQQSIGIALVSFYSVSGTTGITPDSEFGFQIKFPQVGTYSLVELANKTDEDFHLRLGSHTLLPKNGSLKITAETKNESGIVGGTISGTIEGTFYDQADSLITFPVSGSFSLD